MLRNSPRHEPNQDDIVKCNIIPFPGEQNPEAATVAQWLETLRKQLENISSESVFNKKALPDAPTVARTLKCVLNVQTSISKSKRSINNLQIGSNTSIVVQTLLEDQDESIRSLLNKIAGALRGLAGGAKREDGAAVENINHSFMLLDEVLTDLIQEISPHVSPVLTSQAITHEAFRINTQVANQLKGRQKAKMNKICDALREFTVAQQKEHWDLIKKPILRFCRRSRLATPDPFPSNTYKCLQALLEDQEITVEYKLELVMPIICLIILDQKRTKQIVSSNNLDLEYNILRAVWQKWEAKIM